MADLAQLEECVINGKHTEAAELVKAALDEGTPAGDLLDSLRAGMDVVGEKFKNYEFFIPEVLVASRAMQTAMEVLRPKLAEGGENSIGTAIIGTVEGDLHSLGKDLVVYMWEGAGFEVVDLGVDVSPAKFAEEAQSRGAKLLGMSCLLTTTMSGLEDTVNALKEAGIRDEVKVMIGGAPVTQALCDEIGADGFAPDAAAAVDKAKELLGV